MVEKYIQNGVEVPVSTSTEQVQPPAASLPFKGYRTLTIAATLLLAILGSPDIQDIISQYPKSFGSFMVIVTVVCRVITTTPIFDKE